MDGAALKRLEGLQDKLHELQRAEGSEFAAKATPLPNTSAEAESGSDDDESADDELEAEKSKEDVGDMALDERRLSNALAGQSVSPLTGAVIAEHLLCY